MQFKIAFVTAALTTLAAAANPYPPASTCPIDPIQCCETVESIPQALSDSTVLTLLSIIGANLGSLSGWIGLTCNPIDPIFGTCNFQALCCTGSSIYADVISIDCTPVTLGT